MAQLVFSCHQALGGHVRVHRVELKSTRHLKTLDHRKSVNGISFKLESLVNGQAESSSKCVRPLLPLFSMEPPLLWSSEIHLPETVLMDTGNLADLGSNKYCPVTSGKFQSYEDSTSFSHGGISLNLVQDLNKLPHPNAALNDSHLGHDLGTGQEDAGQYNKTTAWNCEGKRRPYIDDAPDDGTTVNTLKKLKIKSYVSAAPTKEPMKENLFPSKNLDLPLSGIGNSRDYEGSGQGTLDLVDTGLYLTNT
ncbi:hypothetical protein K2173_006654 [Erythroxylum novogranatense]|uniref:Uncharacterized protein n=1 Tax=Erythroxylum novogranatense TaxID=1862640 RepID=A0AAV8T5J3_9ROSI|nr:hypothetical protein K2173_006654 [Erythroxylum novogranatense]